MQMYFQLPECKRKTSTKNIYRNIANDRLMMKRVAEEESKASAAIDCLCEYTQSGEDSVLEQLSVCLDSYYADNAETAAIELENFKYYDKKPLMPMFVLSYGRWGRNATLEFLEKIDSQEIYDNTFVFVNKDQKKKYKKGHPKFNYYAVDVDSVGERMLKVLEFCKEWEIEYAFIMEDDIVTFNYIIKCSTQKARCNNKNDVPIGSWLFKYIQYVGEEIMTTDKNCHYIGLRNRFHSNTEDCSIAGYYDEPTVGGAPNLCWFFNVDRFYKLYKAIPKEHYSPQYDWAMLLLTLRNRVNWYVVSGVCKDELMRNSVINYSNDRRQLAEQMIRYYGVEDMVTPINVRSKLGSVKLRCKRKNGKIVNYES